MGERKSDFTLPTYDDIFSTQEQRDDAKLSKIRDIPISEIDDFPNHPFKVRDDEDMLQLIEEVLDAINITRSLSHKGCPYDNAVAEATFKIIKTEFVRNRTFSNLNELKLQLADYVNWFNNRRIHSSLDYLTPARFRLNTLKFVV